MSIGSRKVLRPRCWFGVQRALFGCHSNLRLERPHRNEAGQFALAANAIEERRTLRLRPEGKLPARSPFKSEFHEALPDPAALILWIDQNLGNGGEEIAIRQNADAANQPRPVPCTDVDCSVKCRGSFSAR
jgi:hypothetical protein